MRLRRRKPKGEGESKKALREATEVVHKIEERGPEVNELVAELKTIRARNHFAEHLHDLMYQRKPG